MIPGRGSCSTRNMDECLHFVSAFSFCCISSLASFRLQTRRRIKMKNPAKAGLHHCWVGGERGIRTPGPVTVNGFQDRRNRPLCHLSGGKSTKHIHFAKKKRIVFLILPFIIVNACKKDIYTSASFLSLQVSTGTSRFFAREKSQRLSCCGYCA